jgi:hypothetical protein
MTRKRGGKRPPAEDGDVVVGLSESLSAGTPYLPSHHRTPGKASSWLPFSAREALTGWKGRLSGVSAEVLWVDPAESLQALSPSIPQGTVTPRVSMIPAVPNNTSSLHIRLMQ